MPTLNWHKREEAGRAATRAPYRLLEPVADLSYGDADSENLLIQGDNLDALKALLPYYAGRVRCIAIGPPYDTCGHFQPVAPRASLLAEANARRLYKKETLASDGCHSFPRQ